ncbi:MAG: SusD/RagB family nutrient-binding outer membrane lipoprotein [Bacteroidota bacterium]
MKKYPILLVLTLFFIACDNNGDNNLTRNDLDDPREIFSAALLEAADQASTHAFLLANNVAQFSSKDVEDDITTYNWNSFVDIWNGLFNTISTLRDLERVASAQGDDNYVAVAIILRSWLFSVLTDMYGDIPYTQGAQGDEGGILFPIYDAQQDIYNGPQGLLASLESANNMINTSETIEDDPLFNGNMMMWKKMCNALRLRLLLHASNKIDVSSQMQNIISNEVLFANSSESAVYTYTGEGAFTFPLTLFNFTDFEAVRLSQNLLDVFEQFKDPRLMEYARPTNSSISTNNPSYRGRVNGAISCSSEGSLLGLRYFNYPGHPQVGQNDRAQSIIITYAEQEFILAEAAQRGWITADVAAHYKNGVEAALTMYEVDYSEQGWTDFNDFYDNSGVTFDNTLQSIDRQKWLALYFSGFESYIEMRRRLIEENYNWDAFDFLTPPCNNSNGDFLPLRFTFPDDEANFNQANYTEAVSRMGGDNINTAMWLLTN